MQKSLAKNLKTLDFYRQCLVETARSTRESESGARSCVSKIYFVSKFFGERENPFSKERFSHYPNTNYLPDKSQFVYITALYFSEQG